eukprot:TRINITY_DN2382_c0_g2_i1.p1 TRINITY_DN2382_c0_g2~~TRINITY_DN2382_c0_g2_i1.p1  ORF type:complete len:1325 (+),score=281.92 TRINITY_DN2382_c0_g2_i1:172-4146(+)
MDTAVPIDIGAVGAVDVDWVVADVFLSFLIVVAGSHCGLLVLSQAEVAATWCRKALLGAVAATTISLCGLFAMEIAIVHSLDVSAPALHGKQRQEYNIHYDLELLAAAACVVLAGFLVALLAVSLRLWPVHARVQPEAGAAQESAHPADADQQDPPSAPTTTRSASSLSSYRQPSVRQLYDGQQRRVLKEIEQTPESNPNVFSTDYNVRTLRKAPHVLLLAAAVLMGGSVTVMHGICSAAQHLNVPSEHSARNWPISIAFAVGYTIASGMLLYVRFALPVARNYRFLVSALYGAVCTAISWAGAGDQRLLVAPGAALLGRDPEGTSATALHESVMVSAFSADIGCLVFVIEYLSFRSLTVIQVARDVSEERDIIQSEFELIKPYVSPLLLEEIRSEPEAPLDATGQIPLGLNVSDRLKVSTFSDLLTPAAVLTKSTSDTLNRTLSSGEIKEDPCKSPGSSTPSDSEPSASSGPWSKSRFLYTGAGSRSRARSRSDSRLPAPSWRPKVTLLLAHCDFPRAKEQDNAGIDAAQFFISSVIGVAERHSGQYSSVFYMDDAVRVLCSWNQVRRARRERVCIHQLSACQAALQCSDAAEGKSATRHAVFSVAGGSVLAGTVGSDSQRSQFCLGVPLSVCSQLVSLALQIKLTCVCDEHVAQGCHKAEACLSDARLLRIGSDIGVRPVDGVQGNIFHGSDMLTPEAVFEILSEPCSGPSWADYMEAFTCYLQGRWLDARDGFVRHLQGEHSDDSQSFRLMCLAAHFHNVAVAAGASDSEWTESIFTGRRMRPRWQDLEGTAGDCELPPELGQLDPDVKAHAALERSMAPQPSAGRPSFEAADEERCEAANLQRQLDRVVEALYENSARTDSHVSRHEQRPNSSSVMRESTRGPLSSPVLKSQAESSKQQSRWQSSGSGGGTVAQDESVSQDAAPMEPALVFSQKVPRTFQDAQGRKYHRSSTRLGKGAFGEVWLGMGEDATMVAVKSLCLSALREVAGARSVCGQSQTANGPRPPEALYEQVDFLGGFGAAPPSCRADSDGQRVGESEADKVQHGPNSDTTDSFKSASSSDLEPAGSPGQAGLPGGGCSLSKDQQAQLQAQIKEMVQEVTLMTALRHDNVVQFLGCAVHGWYVLIVMDYLPGGSLATVIQQFGGKLPVSCVRRYTRDIISGLDFIHENNIVHRDLKPANVLVTADGQARLADFGASAELMAKAATTGDSAVDQIAGTPLYMAPEQARGKVMKASDVWALGICLCEFITGKVPWGNLVTNPVVFMYKIASDESFTPTIPEGIPKDARSMVQACCKRDPVLRPSPKALHKYSFLLADDRIDS